MKGKNYERSKKHLKWKTSSRSKEFMVQSGDKPIYLLWYLFYFLCFSFNMFTLMVPYTILFLTKKKKKVYRLSFVWKLWFIIVLNSMTKWAISCAEILYYQF